MNHEIFFENLELLVDAPNGVQKLREIILLLAVQGKLVPQDSRDESAAVLLEKIAAEKDQSLKEKKIKKIRSLPQIDPQQIPYELPYNWEWVRLGDVGHDCGQKKPDKKFTYIDVSAINKEQGVISENVDIIEPSEAPSRARKLVSKGSVIYATVRPYLLNIAIIDKHFEPEPIVSTAFAVLHPYSGILNKYLYYYLRSKPFITYVESEMIGMAYPAINDGKLYKGLVPIPPFEEQKRIVAKVEQLMALCDQLEARQQKKHEKRIRLNNAALDKVITAPTPEEFAQHWQRICDNFDLLYDAPETVGQLRQAILQLAFQGKLTLQFSTDEKVIEVLKLAKEYKNFKNSKFKNKNVFFEKNSLICEGVFDTPISWCWSYLELICDQIGDIDHKMPRAVENGILFLSAKDLKDDGTLDFSNPKFISEKDFERLSRKIKPIRGDIIYSRIGARLGKARLVEVDKKFLISYSCCLIRPIHEYIDKKYLQLFLDSHLALNQAQMGTQSIGVPDLGLGIIRQYKIPIPPREEQKRIVAKVDQLMILCNELEAGLVQAQTDGGRLMEAVVHHVLAG